MESGNKGSAIESPWDLVKILLSPKTLPHVFLLIFGTGSLFALISTINNDPGYAAIIFTSAMISYIILGMIGNRSSVNKWLHADRYSAFLTRLLGPLILPLFFNDYNFYNHLAYYCRRQKYSRYVGSIFSLSFHFLVYWTRIGFESQYSRFST